MPYKLIPAKEPQVDPTLVDAIAQELRLQRADGPTDAPFIVEEQTPRTNRIHVTVVWDSWREVEAEDRARIIMDAYERVRGMDAVLTISSALGLTHAEAKRLGME